MGGRELVPPDGLPEIHQGGAEYRHQRDAPGPRRERRGGNRMTGPRAPMRLPPQPGEMIDRRRPVEFTWNGRKVHGYAGDTIVSALAASGVRVFSRSLKYHRPRGVLTASFHDPGCLVQVDDEPNVRGAPRRVEAGMQVSSQNAWPSLRFDVKAANQLLGRFLGPGF